MMDEYYVRGRRAAERGVPGDPGNCNGSESASYWNGYRSVGMTPAGKLFSLYRENAISLDELESQINDLLR